MCKNLLQRQCTNIKLKKLDAFRTFCTKFLLGFLFIVYIVLLKINYCFSLYIVYGE